MCSCSVVQESMWWNGNQIRDSNHIVYYITEAEWSEANEIACSTFK